MKGNEPDSDNPNWRCLTALVGEDGRPLTIEERLRHAAEILLDNHHACLDEAEAKLEALDLTPEQRLSAFRSVGLHLVLRFEKTLTQIAAELEADHRWMDRHWS